MVPTTNKPCPQFVLLAVFSFLFVGMTHSQETENEDTNRGTHFCCKEIDWSGGWCRSPNCLGPGCGESEKCADLSPCLCNGKIQYTSKSSCAIIKACDEAGLDFANAQKRVQDLTGKSVFAIPGCESALIGVICAYHFPRCIDDGTEFEDVCYSTCLKMYDTCVPEGTDPCPPGSNWTELDNKGQPSRDSNGRIIKTTCPGATGLRRRSFDAALDAIFGIEEKDVSDRNDFKSSQDKNLRGIVAGRYYENEPGKIKLSDFAAVGSKCRRCLTPEQIADGDQCSDTTQQFTDANLACTAHAQRVAVSRTFVLTYLLTILVLSAHVYE